VLSVTACEKAEARALEGSWATNECLADVANTVPAQVKYISRVKRG